MKRQRSQAHAPTAAVDSAPRRKLSCLLLHPASHAQHIAGTVSGTRARASWGHGGSPEPHAHRAGPDQGYRRAWAVPDRGLEPGIYR